MKENLSQVDQVEWNLSSALITEIQSLLSISSRLYLSGNLKKAFWSLKAVKLRFIQSLETKEREELKEIEKKFNESKDTNKTAYVYDVYTEKIMDLLQAYGYLIPLKKDHTRIS